MWLGGNMSTRHRILLADAREMNAVRDGEVQLVVTSPPYWTLKHYRDHPQQLGAIQDYQEFLDQLNQVWRECFRVLEPGGRLCIVVGDVCLSRRKSGRHRVVPLHADITTRCVAIGFDNLAPIFWYKIANIQTEMDRPGYFLGKPFEPNGIIKNDIEYVLLLRKPGEYRHPSMEQRELSRIPKDVYAKWYRQIWDDVGGASTRHHPAPYPVEIADRLIRMFSFIDDTVLDPFVGTGTTTIAAIDAGRNSIGLEIDPTYLELTESRLARHPCPHGTVVQMTDADRASEIITMQPLLAAASPMRRKAASRASLTGRASLTKSTAGAESGGITQMSWADLATEMPSAR
jgi:modification methylase